VGGQLKVVRSAWIAKYDPTRAEREKRLDPVDRSVEHSDVFRDVSWADPGKALGEPWIHSWLMRGAGNGIPQLDYGDLVFAMRTDWLDRDPGRLRHRSLVGVWWFESRMDEWGRDPSGRVRWYQSAVTFPLRRFNFPVPIEPTTDVDAKFDSVRAFHDRSRAAFLPLTDEEAVAVTRACGLPAASLTEPDPNKLAPLVTGLDLGPPNEVRQRILDGARASAHRSSVEKAARDVAVEELRRARFAVVSTELERGLGSDLWARSRDAAGRLLDIRVEVKGLSGRDPWAVCLTRSERSAALADAGAGGWWLAVVTRALRADRRQRWLSSTEAAQVFSVVEADRYVADKVVAATMQRAG
jgi:hypothetical protein